MPLDNGFFQLSFVLVCAFLIYKLIKNVTKSIDSGWRSQNKYTRMLDEPESVFELLQEQDGTGNICLVLTLKSKKKLSKGDVYDALVLLTKRQPMLRAVIPSVPPVPPSAEWSESKYFEVIDGDDIVDFTTSDVKARQWKDMWYEFTSSPHGSGLLWRAVLLQEEYLTDTEVYINTLVFKVCHACFDGVSSMKFCKQFLYYLNSVASGTLSREADIESLDLMPGLSEILLQQKPWPVWQKCLGLPQISKVILKAVVRLSVGTVRPKYPFQCLGPTFSSDTEQKQRLISKVFSVEETVELVRACKSNACTVTGALMAIIHMEFCKILDERRLLLPSQLEHYLAINAQRTRSAH